jgi:hypothetical protein
MDANTNTVELQLSARELALPIGERTNSVQELTRPVPSTYRVPALAQATSRVRRDSYWEEMAWFLIAVSTAALLVMSLFD